jgi:hypothetical protein
MTPLPPALIAILGGVSLMIVVAAYFSRDRVFQILVTAELLVCGPLVYLMSQP